MFASTSTSKFAKSEHFQSYFSEQLKIADSASFSTFAKQISLEPFFKNFINFSWKYNIRSNLDTKDFKNTFFKTCSSIKMLTA